MFSFILQSSINIPKKNKKKTSNQKAQEEYEQIQAKRAAKKQVRSILKYLDSFFFILSVYVSFSSKYGAHSMPIRKYVQGKWIIWEELENFNIPIPPLFMLPSKVIVRVIF